MLKIISILNLLLGLIQAANNVILIEDIACFSKVYIY
jgi:hypothetical protein